MALTSYSKILIRFALWAVGLWATLNAHAQASEYEYPELVVTPSASKRLEAEAQEEKVGRWTAHIPIQTGAFFVMVAGMLAIDDPRLKSQTPADKPMAKWAGIGAISSGAGWLAITGALSATYAPYSTGHAKVKKMQSGSKRLALEKERAAEEALAAPAWLGTRLKWLSIFFNASMATFVISSSEENETRVAGLIATIASLSPLIFESPWVRTYETQMDYRKRIYGPIGEVGLMQNPWTGTQVPTLSLTWSL